MAAALAFLSAVVRAEPVVVRVGVTPNPPLVLWSEGGAPTGLAVEVLRDVAAASGWRLEFVRGEWRGLLVALEDGAIDLIAAIAHSEADAQRLEFTREPLVGNWGVIYRSPDADLQTVTDLRGRRVALMPGSTHADAFRDLARDFDVPFAAVPAEDYEGVLRLVAGGVADAGVVSRLAGIARGDRHEVVATAISFNPAAIHYATPRGRGAAIREAIDRHIASGRAAPGSIYQARLKRWLRVPSGAPVPTWFPWAVAGALAGLVAAFGGIVWLRRRIRTQTRQLAEQARRFRELFDGAAISIWHEDVAEVFRSLQRLRREGLIDLRAWLEEDPQRAWALAKQVRVIEVNRATLALFGADSEDDFQRRIDQTFGPDAIEVFTGSLLAIWNRAETFVSEAHYRRLDGAEIIAIVSIPVPWSEAEAAHVPVSIVDVTERERLRRDLMQAQKMESVGRLAGGVAHDFNNMLGVILGRAELALMRVGAEHPAHGDLVEITRAAERSADLTRQLLAYARRQAVAPEILRLEEAVGALLPMLRRLIGEDTRLQWVPQRGPWSVRIDRTQVHQILANLCLNARDAITGPGTVILETAHVRIDERGCAELPDCEPGEYVSLLVCDDGAGMDPETRRNMFEPFFTTKDVGEGTGLGLATVYGIVRQNGGFIGVETAPGRGTTVRIYLPRAADAPEETREPQMPPGLPEAASGTVLLVEDEPALLHLAEEMLSDIGCHVIAATGAAAALRAAEGHAGRIDLLITDVVMPEMNGRELADALSARHPALRVLFMSGYPAEVIDRRGVIAAGERFLQKPFSREALVAKVHALLRDLPYVI